MLWSEQSFSVSFTSKIMWTSKKKSFTELSMGTHDNGNLQQVKPRVTWITTDHRCLIITLEAWTLSWWRISAAIPRSWFVSPSSWTVSSDGVSEKTCVTLRYYAAHGFCCLSTDTTWFKVRLDSGPAPHFMGWMTSVIDIQVSWGSWACVALRGYCVDCMGCDK